MARQTTVLVKDLREDDTITMAPPRMKVLSKRPLSSEYNTSIKGFILEVKSLDPRMKGYTTTILLADTDTVKMNARPSLMQRLKKRWKAYTSEVKKRKATATFPTGKKQIFYDKGACQWKENINKDAEEKASEEIICPPVMVGDINNWTYTYTPGTGYQLNKG